MNTDTVLGYRRPAMPGGPASPDPDALTVRWYGTSNFELNFHDRVVLLDTFYDRGPRMRSLGFRPDEVVRADAMLIGHPHYDHISDAAQVASATGTPVVVHPLGADVLTQGGLDVSRIHAVTWSRCGRLPSCPEEEAHAAAVLQRGNMAPEVFTEGTMCLVIDIDGYRIVYRDSGGPVSEEERAFFADSPGCDLASWGSSAARWSAASSRRRPCRSSRPTSRGPSSPVITTTSTGVHRPGHRAAQDAGARTVPGGEHHSAGLCRTCDDRHEVPMITVGDPGP